MPRELKDRYLTGRTLLGAAIRSRRTGLGLTMQQLADAADLSFSMIYTLEKGRALPSLPALDAIATALATTAIDLLAVYPWDGSPATETEA